MFTCTQCNFTSDLEAYYQHIRKWHSNQTFECGQFGCIREYDCVKSLKRHLKTHLETNQNERYPNAPTNKYLDVQPIIKISGILRKAFEYAFKSIFRV